MQIACFLQIYNIIYTVVVKTTKEKKEKNYMLKKMIKTSAVALLLAGTTVGSITPAFAQIQTKDVTEKDFLEYIERLKKELKTILLVGI